MRKFQSVLIIGVMRYILKFCPVYYAILLLVSCHTGIEKSNSISGNSVPDAEQTDPASNITNLHRQLLNTRIAADQFIKLKGSASLSHGFHPETDIYYHPDTDGYYYEFLEFPKPSVYTDEEWMELCHEDGVRLIVYHYGKALKENANNEMIAIKARVSDPDLGIANYVGRSLPEIRKTLGNNYLQHRTFMYYAMNRNMLALRIDNYKVTWFEYLRINREPDDEVMAGIEKDYQEWH